MRSAFKTQQLHPLYHEKLAKNLRNIDTFRLVYKTRPCGTPKQPLLLLLLLSPHLSESVTVTPSSLKLITYSIVSSEIITSDAVCLRIGPIIISFVFRLSIFMWLEVDQFTRGPIYKICYELSQDYRKFVVRPTYESDLQCTKISLRNVIS